LGSEIKTEYIDRKQITVVFVGELEKRQMPVYPSTRDTDVKGIVEILLELREAVL
jgi:hypothetical protein